jgi:hypothetical protein
MVFWSMSLPRPLDKLLDLPFVWTTNGSENERDAFEDEVLWPLDFHVVDVAADYKACDKAHRSSLQE